MDINEFKKKLELKNLSSILDYIIETYIEEGKREVIKEFLNLIQGTNYAIVGGAAVSLWYDGARAVSPEDFDIKILPSEEDNILKILKDNKFKLVRKNAFIDSTWLVFEKNGQGIDIGIAEKKWDVEGIKKAKVIPYMEMQVKVVPIDILIVSKLFAGRRKDYKDIVLLLKSKKVSPEEIKAVVKEYIPSELPELENLLMYSKTFKPEDLDHLFSENKS